MSIEQITSEALRLNLHDRVRLAKTLWENIDDPLVVFDSSDDEAIVLAKLRDKEIESGEVQPLSHMQLMNRLQIF